MLLGVFFFKSENQFNMYDDHDYLIIKTNHNYLSHPPLILYIYLNIIQET